MFTKAPFALLLTAGLLASALAAQEQEPRMYSTERPIETQVTGLPLPRQVPGSMTLRPCDVCTPVTLALDAGTQYFVNRKPATFADLRTFAQSSSANAVVFYDSHTNAVTRIVVSNAR